jgi:protein TonB
MMTPNIFLFQTLVLNSNEVLMTLFGLAGVTFGLTLAIRKYQKQQVSTHKIEEGEQKSSLMRKYKTAQTKQHRSSIRLFAIIIALGSTYTCLAWTKFDYTRVFNDTNFVLIDDIQVNAPITQPQKPQLPPVSPEPPKVEPLQIEAVEFEPEQAPEPKKEPVEQKGEEGTTELTAPNTGLYTGPIAEPELEPEPVEPEIEIFTFVEQMPRFTGCETMEGNEAVKQACATQKLMGFVYNNIKYPAIARENGIQGIVVLRFTVWKDGSLRDIKIAKDPGGGLAREAIRVVKKMPKWLPGKQRGRNVPVKFTLPIRFKLQ